MAYVLCLNIELFRQWRTSNFWSIKFWGVKSNSIHNGYSIQQRLSSQPVNARNPGIINSSNTAYCWNLLLLCAKCSKSRAQVGEMRQIMRTPLIKECGAIASLPPPADLWAPMPQRVTWQSQGAPISPTQVIKGKRMIHLIPFHWVFLGNHSKRFWLWILF